MTEQELMWPDGKADVQTPAAAATLNLTIKNRLTHVNLSSAMAADMTVNFAIDGVLDAGARVLLKAASDGTARSITTGTNGQGTVEAGVISKTKVLVYELNNKKFTLISARQID